MLEMPKNYFSTKLPFICLHPYDTPGWFIEKVAATLPVKPAFFSYSAWHSLSETYKSGAAVLVLGRDEARSFLGLRNKRTINAVLGSVVSLPAQPHKFIPTYSQQDLQASLFKQRLDTFAHFNHGYTLAACGEHTMPACDLLVPETAEEVANYLAALSPGTYSVDIETTGKLITHFGVGNASEAISIPLCTAAMQPYWPNVADETCVFNAIRNFLTNPLLRKGGHNFRYDLSYIISLFGVWPRGIAFDTYYLSHAISPENSHSLAALAGRSAKHVFPAWKLLGHVDSEKDTE